MGADRMFRLLALATIALVPALGMAADTPDLVFPGGSVQLDGDQAGNLSTPLRLMLILTVLSLAPSLLLMTTAFTRIIIVLAMLRHSLGMPSTPPNAVLISFGLLLTALTMAPVWTDINQSAFSPYIAGELDDKAFAERALLPIRGFMIAQVREKDLALVLDLADSPVPEDISGVETIHLVPAFMLSELRRAFEIGFIVFLPFILLDIIVASALMSLGMIMVPPLAFSLPLKILLFVLIDGWALLTASLVNSFVAV